MRRAVLGLLLGAAIGCKAKEPTITEPWADDFERAELGPGWNATGAEYQLVGGKLNVKGAYNHPLWLRRKLPTDAVIEFDVMSKSAAGDIKVQAWGDGESYDPDKGNNDSVTGYVFIFGGWNNSQNYICRLGEHDDARRMGRNDVHVQPGKTYHFTITRKAGALDWKIDGQPFLAWTDPQPLSGSGHEYLAFDDWESDVTFDNLKIRPNP